MQIKHTSILNGFDCIVDDPMLTFAYHEVLFMTCSGIHLLNECLLKRLSSRRLEYILKLMPIFSHEFSKCVPKCYTLLCNFVTYVHKVRLAFPTQRKV